MYALGAGAGCNGGILKPDVKLGLVVDELLKVNARNDVFVCASELAAGVAEEYGHIAQEEVALVVSLAVNQEGDEDVGVVGVGLVLNILEVLYDGGVLTLADLACEGVVHEVSEIVHFVFSFNYKFVNL